MINWKNKSQILGKLNKTQNISLCLKTKHLKMSFVKGQPWLSAPNLLAISVTLKLECGNIFDHQGLGTNTDKDDGKSNTQKRSLGIWYVILDIILASCTVCGLLINCKNRRGRVFFEVLDLSASFFFRFFMHMLKYSKYLKGVKYMKYFLNHVHVKYNILVTSNNTRPGWAIMIWIT